MITGQSVTPTGGRLGAPARARAVARTTTTGTGDVTDDDRSTR